MQFFNFLPPINLPWCRMRFHNKFWPDRFSCLDVYRILKDSQTSHQQIAKYINKWNDVDDVDYIDYVDDVDDVDDFDYIDYVDDVD